MSDPPSSATWLANATQKLAADGFSISRDVTFEGSPYSIVAHRSRFELSKFGNAETFFVFGELPDSNFSAIQQYNAGAFRYAAKSKTFFLPRGLCEAVFCFPVGLTDSLDHATAQLVRSTTPPKHWSAAEIPTVYVRDTGHIHFFEKTPVWGAAYYTTFREQIRMYLS